MKSEIIFKRILTAAGILTVLFLLPFAVKIFAPFVLAFIIASASQPLVRFLERRTKISRGVSSAALVTLIISVTTALIIAAAFKLFSQAKNLVLALPDIVDSLNTSLAELRLKISAYTHGLSPEVGGFLRLAEDELSERLNGISVPISEQLIAYAKSVAAALPGFLFFITMFILSTFFFIKDYRLVTNFIREILPKKAVCSLQKIKAVMSKAFSSYIKAQLILMLITCLLVAVCLWIVGMKNPLLWGIVCGAVDALPFFGTAAVLVPWALISLIYGDTYAFTALLVIQMLVFTVRQLSEPKIVSRQIGLHPLLTLVSVYIGLRFFGILGMIIAPALTLLAVNIYVSYKESAAGV